MRAFLISIFSLVLVSCGSPDLDVDQQVVKLDLLYQEISSMRDDKVFSSAISIEETITLSDELEKKFEQCKKIEKSITPHLEPEKVKALKEASHSIKVKVSESLKVLKMRRETLEELKEGGK